MAQTDFLPRRDLDLKSWADNFASVIAGDPELYGSTPGQSGELSAAVAAYGAALSAASDPSTRTRVMVTDKDLARAALTPLLRDAARRARAQSGLSGGQLQALGLPVHMPAVQRCLAPQSSPRLMVSRTGGGRHELRLFDQDTPTRKALPRSAAGAQVFYFATPRDSAPTTPLPTDLSRWRFAGLATKSDFTIRYDAEDIGKTAHLRAVWYNRKGETGPVSGEITAMIAA